MPSAARPAPGTALDLRGEAHLEAPLAQPLHQRVFSSTRLKRPLVDDAHPVGELFGLFEVVRGEHDGRALAAQLANVRPQVAAQLDVDAGGRLVEEHQLRAGAPAPWR